MITADDAVSVPTSVLVREVATRLFSSNGYTGTTIRNIANEIGLLPGSIYAHVSSKEALLFEIVSSGIARHMDATEHIVHSREPEDERLRAAIVEHLKVIAESPERTLVVFYEWRHLTGEYREQVATQRRRYELLYMDLVAEGISSGRFNAALDPRVAVLGTLGALNWAAEWFRWPGPQTAEEVGASLADVLLSGLATDPR